MEQVDGLMAPPTSNKLLLGFHPVGSISIDPGPEETRKIQT